MNSANNKHSQPRSSPKTKSIQINSLKWKDDLRIECMERAKAARRDRLRRQRFGESINSRINTNDFDGERRAKRDREEQFSEFEDCKIGEQHDEFVTEDDPIQTAKALVEQEMQKAMMGLRHCHQFAPLNGEENSCKRKMKNGEDISVDVTMDHSVGDSNFDDQCIMSHEEYMELVNAVTEELEREDEFIEEELFEIQRLEALEHERLLREIDDFESWEAEQQLLSGKQSSTVYSSPFINASSSSPLVTCPICNSSSLFETPFDGIKCSNIISANSSCNFALDMGYDGLSLQHLKSQLASVYEDHARECDKGVLKFRMENRMGVSVLMADCKECGADLVVL